jgi:ribose 5-phosphate isomerase RpiB
MTNGEWLRTQDDETMADFIAEGEAYARVLSVTNGADGTIIVKENIKKWLKAEYEEGESND